MQFLERARCGPHPLSSVLLLLLLMSNAGGVRAEPLTLAAAERVALERDAGTASLAAEADMFRERAVAARQLPDPEARIGAVNVPTDSFSLNADDMTMVEVGVMQRFPTGRAAEGRRYEALAVAQDAKADARRREVVKNVRVAWYEAAVVRRTQELLAEQRRWLARMTAAGDSMYASGEAEQAEILAARLETTMLDERELMLREDERMRGAALDRWLGDGVDVALELPRPAVPPPLAALEHRLDAHPTHAETEAQTAAAHAEVDAARAMFRPGFAVEVGYGLRSGRDPAMGEARSDMLSAMVTVELPIFTRDRQRRTLAAAQAGVRAADLMREDHLRMLRMSLREQHARATRAAAVLELLDARVLPVARAAADAALAAYRAGDGGFDAVASAARARLDAETRRVRAVADLAIAVAEIDALVGGAE